jgi:hypothetical protein
MGRCESAFASIGIKILLSDLVSQINATTMNLIKKMLYDGCIEDSNDFYNQAFEQIIGDNGVEENAEEFKEYLTRKFTERVRHDDALLERYLLVPVEELVSNDRWGWSREGTNAMSTTMGTFLDDLPDILSTAFKETYKDINNFTFVFMIKQYAG